jgi:hypothetical protein
MCPIIAQDRERLSAELNEKMNAVGRHLDEIKNLKTQHDMLVKTNAAARVRLSVRCYNVLGSRAHAQKPWLVKRVHIRLCIRLWHSTPYTSGCEHGHGGSVVFMREHRPMPKMLFVVLQQQRLWPS